MNPAVAAIAADEERRRRRRELRAAKRAEETPEEREERLAGRRERALRRRRFDARVAASRQINYVLTDDPNPPTNDPTTVYIQRNLTRQREALQRTMAPPKPSEPTPIPQIVIKEMRETAIKAGLKWSCPVCMDDELCPSVVTILPCGHKLCNDCCEGCMDSNNYKCPVCRADF